MGIVFSQTDASSLVLLEGAIDISVAAELKAALLEAIAAGKAIHVSAEAVSELDVTAYQLLWAAERETWQLGVKFMLTGQMPPLVKSALSDMGFEACAFLR